MNTTDNKNEYNVSLESLLDAIAIVKRKRALADATEITGLTADSRKVVPGGAFVAVRGVAVDGHKFIDKAIASGAVLIVGEELPDELPEGVEGVTVADSREALGLLASRYYGDTIRSLVGASSKKVSP